MLKPVAYVVLAVASLTAVGCGQDSPAKVKFDEGAAITQALASSDVGEVRCTGSKKYGPGQTVSEPSARMKRTSESVIFDDPLPSSRVRSSDTPLWVSKAPLLVKVGKTPVDVAVMDSGGPKTKLAYDGEGGQFSLESAATRMQFLPCDDQTAWRGYAGAIYSDAPLGCVSLAVGVKGDLPSITAVPVGKRC